MISFFLYINEQFSLFIPIVLNFKAFLWWFFFSFQQDKLKKAKHFFNTTYRWFFPSSWIFAKKKRNKKCVILNKVWIKNLLFRATSFSVYICLHYYYFGSTSSPSSLAKKIDRRSFALTETTKLQCELKWYSVKVWMEEANVQFLIIEMINKRYNFIFIKL